ncbi:putative integral membrane protein (TIGR00697 family) [Trueperella bonasi]|uniref:Probable queuosine precursor transporter n=1 Tax=Trueperella bonasi TaxID=312286 RepID=A0ABT9NG11_9ACTO|nr:queuosine precursor transporter [Trueperella bonasi]MDP9806317.1 putative integral membrane protein (TIGR00697 family) [Trueperella bonasi]
MKAAYAPIRRGYYDVFVALFVAFLLLSNIAATKLIGVGPLVFDGGALLFPLTYVIGDVLAEVYGFKAARKAIGLGFVASIIGALTFSLVQIAPPAAEYENQAAFEAVLGVVPRFVLASLCGYIVGQLLNAYVLTWIKNRWGEKHLWARLVGSTVVGEFVDTILFCVVAWGGVVSWGTILNLTATGFGYKVIVEIVLLPITYVVINWVKNNEPGYGGRGPGADESRPGERGPGGEKDSR